MEQVKINFIENKTTMSEIDEDFKLKLSTADQTSIFPIVNILYNNVHRSTKSSLVGQLTRESQIYTVKLFSQLGNIKPDQYSLQLFCYIISEDQLLVKGVFNSGSDFITAMRLIIDPSLLLIDDYLY